LHALRLLNGPLLHLERTGRCSTATTFASTPRSAGGDTCPSKSVPAGEIERLVVEQIKAIGRDPSLISATLKQTRKQVKETVARLDGEKAALERNCESITSEVRKLATDAAMTNGATSARLGDSRRTHPVAETTHDGDSRTSARIERSVIDERDVATALGAFRLGMGNRCRRRSRHESFNCW